MILSRGKDVCVLCVFCVFCVLRYSVVCVCCVCSVVCSVVCVILVALPRFLFERKVLVPQDRAQDGRRFVESLHG